MEECVESFQCLLRFEVTNGIVLVYLSNDFYFCNEDIPRLIILFYLGFHICSFEF
jgi:hypothetical protein